MHFRPKKHNFFLTFILIVQFFITNALPALAFFGGPSIPSASSVMSDIEKRYHLNSAALQNQGEIMNVSQNKSTVPDVSLFFSPSDPKEGERITAKAFPTFFSNTEKDLYYTWFLRRDGCDIGSNKLSSCDTNNDGIVTIEDWKVTATKILIRNGYDPSDNEPINSDTDNDGYKAHFGGNNQTGTKKDYCYVNDPSSGTNYELADGYTKPIFYDASWSCNFGRSPVCMVDNYTLADTNLNINTSSSSSPDTGGSASSSATGPIVQTDFTGYVLAGVPACLSDNNHYYSVVCSVGNPYCVQDSYLNSSNPIPVGAAIPLATCRAVTATNGQSSPITSKCKHLFPNAPGGYSSGDSSFPLAEERFWGTNPSDPSTADNGNKDEANATGLGQSSFIWNYQRGDKVGVAVEGNSMIPTKHDNNSFMIMWAFSNKKCSPSFTRELSGSYNELIRNYLVEIPALNMDLNDCIPNSLVDPTAGGQATKLTLSLSATPENPVNDSTFSNSRDGINPKGGEILSVQASVDNADKNLINTLFEWKVFLGEDIGDFENGRAIDITSDLRDQKLLGNIKGSGLDSITLEMNIKKVNSNTIDIENYGYLQFKVTAIESFGEYRRRKGNSDIIVKFSNTGGSVIFAHRATPDGVKVQVDNENIICDDYRMGQICPVIKNEIIGLRASTGAGINLNHRWTINGVPLLCTARVADACAKGGSGDIDSESQGEINFFPVTGNPGDTYTVTVTANGVMPVTGRESRTDRTVSLTRTFIVVEPSVTLKSTDESTVWRKFLGQYKDIIGTSNSSGQATCPNGLCDDLSESIYQTYAGSTASFYADFVPDFLGKTATLAFTVDGVDSPATSWLSSSLTPQEQQTTPFTINKLAGEVYDIRVKAEIAQDESLRKALMTIWGISPFTSPEIHFASSVQLEVNEALTTEGPLSGPRKYYAMVASYIPSSVLFTFRIFLSAILVLFVLHFVNRILEDRRLTSFVKEVADREKE